MFPERDVLKLPAVCKTISLDNFAYVKIINATKEDYRRLKNLHAIISLFDKFHLIQNLKSRIAVLS